MEGGADKDVMSVGAGNNPPCIDFTKIHSHPKHPARDLLLMIVPVGTLSLSMTPGFTSSCSKMHYQFFAYLLCAIHDDKCLDFGLVILDSRAC